MKVYVAAPFGDWPYVLTVHGYLADAGHEFTSAWAVHAAAVVTGEVDLSPHARADLARGDLDAIDVADALIAIVPEAGGCGMWIEVGYALKAGKRVLLVGQAAWSRTIFSELTERHISIVDAIDALAIP